MYFVLLWPGKSSLLFLFRIKIAIFVSTANVTLDLTLSCPLDRDLQWSGPGPRQQLLQPCTSFLSTLSLTAVFLAPGDQALLQMWWAVAKSFLWISFLLRCLALAEKEPTMKTFKRYQFLNYPTSCDGGCKMHFQVCF